MENLIKLIFMENIGRSGKLKIIGLDQGFLISRKGINKQFQLKQKHQMNYLHL